MFLAAHPDVAWRLAVERLDTSWRRFERTSPLELAWRLWGERRRRNTALRALAWAVSTTTMPHVVRRDHGLVTPDALFWRVSAGDLDEDEVN